MERMAGGGVEMDDRTICDNVWQTSVEGKHLIEASIWERMLGNYRLFPTRTVAKSASVDLVIFSSGSYAIGFHF